MKNLKLSLVVVFVAMASIVAAQNSSFSIKGGVNLSNFYGDELNDKSMKVGFHAGIGADLEFAPNVGIQTGLFFSAKGAEYKYSTAEVNVTANYLQLPVHVAYKIDVTPGTKVVLHAGPYVAYGLGGKTKVNLGGTQIGSVDTFKDDSTIDAFNGLKRFDAGLGLGVGFEFGKLLVDLGWDMGLTNLSRINNADIKTQNAYLSLGYKF